MLGVWCLLVEIWMGSVFFFRYFIRCFSFGCWKEVWEEYCDVFVIRICLKVRAGVFRVFFREVLEV